MNSNSYNKMKIEALIFIFVAAFRVNSEDIPTTESFLTIKSFEGLWQDSCKPGWTLYEGKCYQLGNQFGRILQLNWEDASKNCEQQGSHLMTIGPKNYHRLFLQLQLGVQRNIWVGLRYYAMLAHWHDGSQVTFDPSFLQNGKGFKCLQVSFSNRNMKDSINWANCRDRKPFVCQMPTGKLRKVSVCPKESGTEKRFKDSCYLLMNSEEDWDTAEKHCSAKYNGHLVTIPDPETMKFLDQAFPENKARWVGFKLKSGGFQTWSSGRYVDVELVKKFLELWIKSVAATKKYFFISCLLVKKDSWVINDCNAKNPYICEVYLGTPPTVIPQFIENACPGPPEEWLNIGDGRCLYFSKSQAKNWNAANFDCLQRGGYLISIHSEKEQNFLHSFHSFNPKNLYVGLVRETTGKTFRWIDGSKLDYETWHKDEPNNIQGNENCVESVTMKWNDIRCETDRNLDYICAAATISSNRTSE